MTVTLGKPQVCAPQGIGYTDVIDTTPHQYRQMVWQAQLRTQVITRAPFQSSEASIRISLAEQWCASTNSYIGNEVEDIFRDELDKRRFYIRYRTYQLRRQIAGNGFTIGTTQIPAEPAIFYGMIPKVPPRLTIQIMTTILKQYGELHDVYYETYPDTSVSTRRLFFSYSKVNNQVPEAIEVDGITLFIRDRRARKQCTKCEKYGHTVGWCTIKDEGDPPPIISEVKEETSTFSPKPRRKKKKKKKSKTTPTSVMNHKENNSTVDHAVDNEDQQSEDDPSDDTESDGESDHTTLMLPIQPASTEEPLVEQEQTKTSPPPSPKRRFPEYRYPHFGPGRSRAQEIATCTASWREFEKSMKLPPGPLPSEDAMCRCFGDFKTLRDSTTGYVRPPEINQLLDTAFALRKSQQKTAIKPTDESTLAQPITETEIGIYNQPNLIQELREYMSVYADHSPPWLHDRTELPIKTVLDGTAQYLTRAEQRIIMGIFELPKTSLQPYLGCLQKPHTMSKAGFIQYCLDVSRTEFMRSPEKVRAMKKQQLENQNNK